MEYKNEFYLILLMKKKKNELAKKKFCLTLLVRKKKRSPVWLYWSGRRKQILPDFIGLEEKKSSA